MMSDLGHLISKAHQMDTNRDSKTSIDLKQYFFSFEVGKYDHNPRRCKIISSKTTATLKR